MKSLASRLLQTHKLRQLASYAACLFAIGNSPVAFADSSEFTVKNVSFKSGKHNLSGVFYLPESSNGKAVTVIGPVGFVKEQAPTLYAKSLVAKGYRVLIFDPTYHGESEGEPRRFESGDAKTKDIIASLDFLSSFSSIDSSEIYGVAICQGINWMTRAANTDSRLKRIALVAGHYLHPDVAKKYNGGEERLRSVLEKAMASKRKFLASGEVDYVPIVGLVEQDALLSAPAVYEWYTPWQNNVNGKGGKWENRITRMSLAEIWGGNTQDDLEKLTTPVLVIHSNRAASGNAIPRTLFNVIPSEHKALIWYEDQFQTQFYDNEALAARVAHDIDNFFQLSR